MYKTQHKYLLLLSFQLNCMNQLNLNKKMAMTIYLFIYLGSIITLIMNQIKV